MKRIVCMLLCAFLVLSTAACGNYNHVEKGFDEIIEDYEARYGVISKNRNLYFENDALGGVSCIELLDFNGDGNDELLIIFDNCTEENKRKGALTCHIYAQQPDGPALVYDSDLSTADYVSFYLYNGRTLPVAEVNNNIYLAFHWSENVEFKEYPREEYNNDTEENEIVYDYDIKNVSYLCFDGTEFSEVKTLGVAMYFDIFTLGGDLCTEEEYENAFIEITKYIECSTFRFDELLKRNDEVKKTLGLEKTVTSTFESVPYIEKSQEPDTSKATETTQTTTQQVVTTTMPTTQQTEQIVSSIAVADDRDSGEASPQMSVAEICSAVAAHYTAQRTDGGGYNAFENEVADNGDSYTILLRNVMSPEQESEADRRFREEGIIPSANVLAFSVNVDLETGLVTDDFGGESWYLW